jgi:hypothetical protein
MKVSSLITKLTDLIDSNGDVDVKFVIEDDGWTKSILDLQSIRVRHVYHEPHDRGEFIGDVKPDDLYGWDPTIVSIGLASPEKGADKMSSNTTTARPEGFYLLIDDAAAEGTGGGVVDLHLMDGEQIHTTLPIDFLLYNFVMRIWTECPSLVPDGSIIRQLHIMAEGDDGDRHLVKFGSL